MFMKVAGGLAIVVGLGGFALGFVGFPSLDWETAAAFAGTGVTAIWGAGKGEKFKAAIAAFRNTK
jgi:hypothetical protein